MARPKGRPLPEDHKRRISESVRRTVNRKANESLMPTEPQNDLVVEARELARTAMEANQFARRSRELLRQLCDEVERLRFYRDHTEACIDCRACAEGSQP